MLNFEGCSAWNLVILPRFIDIDRPQQLLFSINQRKTAKLTAKTLQFLLSCKSHEVGSVKRQKSQGKNFTVYTEL
jgi:hypothetical protein